MADSTDGQRPVRPSVRQSCHDDKSKNQPKQSKVGTEVGTSLNQSPTTPASIAFIHELMSTPAESVLSTNTSAVAPDDDSPPTTVLVILGPMEFETSGKADIMSIKIRTPEERAPTLEAAAAMTKEESLVAMHVILKGSSVSSLYDDTIVATFFEALAPGAESTVHVLGTADMPVQPADVNSIRVSLLMSGLQLESEGLTEGEEGGWTLTARKPKPGGDSDDEEEEEEEEPKKEELEAIAE